MIFPDWGTIPTQTKEQTLPLFREWAVNWATGSFALRNGQPYMITGTEALKIWIRCALHPDSRRFDCSAHTPDYGNRLSALIGEGGDPGILENRICREIRDTLLVSPYIIAVDAFSCVRTGSRLTVRFTVHTIYETFDEEVSIAYEL